MVSKSVIIEGYRLWPELSFIFFNKEGMFQKQKKFPNQQTPLLHIITYALIN